MTAARTPPLATPAAHPRPGLRERKKIKTRAAIRDATYGLIREQGYDATTIEQIAERAEVSPSTVLRYFPAKEDIVLMDEYAPILVAELRARPAGEPWLDSLRQVFRTGIALGAPAPAPAPDSTSTSVSASEEAEVTRLRTTLMVEVPAVRTRMTENMSGTGRLLCQVIGERTGRSPDGFEVRVHAMSLVAALTEAALYWAEHGHEDDLGALVDRALDVLEQGLAPGKP
ncbi:TetR/AcrR family transcriptional regulator [Streptomyces sp. NPDC017991]|uniref:TetR/AcrR family transcriptional regulator n=1 Tax=Streptomyces sp. NPDC017991 TaxID=3365026 RepID=UPI0037A776E0